MYYQRTAKCKLAQSKTKGTKKNREKQELKRSTNCKGFWIVMHPYLSYIKNNVLLFPINKAKSLYNFNKNMDKV